MMPGLSLPPMSIIARRPVAPRTTILDSGTNWTAPHDFSPFNYVDCIGAGGGGGGGDWGGLGVGGGGGGGGAWARKNNVAILPFETISFQLGVGGPGGGHGGPSAGGTPTWVKNAAGTTLCQAAPGAGTSGQSSGGGSGGGFYGSIGDSIHIGGPGKSAGDVNGRGGGWAERQRRGWFARSLRRQRRR